MSREELPRGAEEGAPDRAAAAGGADQQPEQQAPEPDPAACRGLALCPSHFQEGVDAGEWEHTDLRYYLEPAGVLQTRLRCARCGPDDRTRAGILMPRAAWRAHRVYLDDGVNPASYALSYPKEVGYVKPLAHYRDETRAHARYPFSKKY